VIANICFFSLKYLQKEKSNKINAGCFIHCHKTGKAPSDIDARDSCQVVGKLEELLSSI
jgi:hypothetical protein